MSNLKRSERSERSGASEGSEQSGKSGKNQAVSGASELIASYENNTVTAN